MKWFKHDSDANMDAKLKRLRMKYGMEGYGLYWFCLELIARNVDRNNLTFELEHDSEIIANDTGIHYERVQEMMAHMISLQLFEQSDGVITCLKMAHRLDETTSKNPQIKHLQTKLPTQSGNNRESLPTVSGKSPARIEEKRTDKKRNTNTVESDDSPVVVELETNTGENFPIRESHCKEWTELFPAVDVLQEVRSMRAWLIANPRNRKTSSGMMRFAASWLSRAQNSAKTQQPKKPDPFAGAK